MSLLPLLVKELLEDYAHPSNGVYDHDLHGARRLHTPPGFSVPLSSGYLRPWRVCVPIKSGVSNIHHDKKSFKVTLDVQQFKPEELKVKVVDGFLVVDGKHDERTDEHGFVSRQFTRRYKLPDDIDDKKMTSNVSSDGVLTVEAPAKNTMPAIFYQEVPIVLTNAPASVMNREEPKEKRRREEKSLLPYYRNVPIIQTNEPAKQPETNKTNKEEDMETGK